MGRVHAGTATEKRGFPFLWVPISFFLIDLFAFFYLTDFSDGFAAGQLWPLAFGGLWAVMLSAFLRIFPRGAARVLYGVLYFAGLLYAGFEMGYYFIFDNMMWITDLRHVGEGADYIGVIFGFPVVWWLLVAGMLALGIVILAKFPRWKWKLGPAAGCALLTAASVAGAWFLPQAVFLADSNIKFAGSDYGRSQSAEAAYTNMFNTRRLYEVCGLRQTAAKDIYANLIFPMTPGYAAERAAGIAEIDAYFDSRKPHEPNDMTGIFKDKNVVLVLMESMDDWMIGEHTPTISRLMSEGINFTQFYTPVYGGIRTFNTEFCTNNGVFLSSKGGYAFDYVTNNFDQSLPNLLRDQGYTAKTFHYNDPSFYSRGEFSPAMGYEEYVCYADYIGEGEEDSLYDDKLLFDNPELNDLFFREADKRLNFIITRSAHLSYKYNEVLSYWGLKLYPEFRGMTGNEEEDCAYLKARLVDDMYTRLLEELAAHGELENTVIIGITDHLSYGIKDEELLYSRSGVDEALLLEKTPCFIWSADLEPLEVTKTLNTSDMLPTMLNLLGVDSPYRYIGNDAFDPNYIGYVPFSDGSWISGSYGFDAGESKLIYLKKARTPSAEMLNELSAAVQQFIDINNLILDTNYYATK